jgi:hypothetical protein
MGEARWRARGRGKVAAGIDQAPAQPAPCRPQLWRSPGRRHLDRAPAKPVRSTAAWGAPCGPARPCNRGSSTSSPSQEGRGGTALSGSSRDRVFAVAPRRPAVSRAEWEPWWPQDGRQYVDPRLDVTRRCRWRRCGAAAGRGSGGAAGASSGRCSGHVAGARPAHGATAPAPCPLGLLLIAALGELVATVGATCHPPAVQQVQGGLRCWLDVHGASLRRRGRHATACRATARQRPRPGARKPGRRPPRSGASTGPQGGTERAWRRREGSYPRPAGQAARASRGTPRSPRAGWPGAG